MPLTLDDFTQGAYQKTLLPGQSDSNLQQPPGRQTVFTNGATSSNPWNQPSSLAIGIQNRKGILIVSPGFGAACSLFLNYGTFQNDPPGSPLHLNLRAYSSFQINLAGLSASVGLTATAVIAPHSGGLLYDAGVGIVRPPSENPFSINYPWTSFKNGALHLSDIDVSDIDGIQVVLGGGGTTVTYGILSFQALP
ncbi:hypothetical protein SBA4_2010004 [Candidatus Sulfopaludibacter sp. SbA4]|nr:hypothetical protein SBA4_2010004 [Candidatus Sulfopaludibacter sp. SbA4]